MQILILTGRFGMGHYSAAEAIREQIQETSPSAHVAVVDLMDWLFPEGSQAIYRSFGLAVHYVPFLYNALNHASGHAQGVPLERTARRRLETLLQNSRPDLVISTLPLSSQYISAYKSATFDPIPLFTFITDIAVHKDWIAPQTDRYFVGSEETKQVLIDRGVLSDRITVSGIPVRSEFCRGGTAKREASAKHEVLMMGGGLGLLPADGAFFESLSAEESVHLSVLTGKNERLLRHLRQHFPAIEAVGWTSDVARYLRRAELMITKAGGITTFEAIQMGTPLYILHPFLVQEVQNAQFIERSGIGQIQWDKDADPALDILALLRNGEDRRTMRDNMARLRANQENAMERIWEEVAS